MMFHCPFPGHTNNDRNPSLGVTKDNGRWYCFTCGRGGDAISWVREFYNMSFKDACLKLEDGMNSSGFTRTRESKIENVLTSSDIWQQKANSLINESKRNLWGSGGEKAFLYLRNRGLSERTITRHRLGLLKFDTYNCPEDWGYSKESKRIWLPKGITIPTFLQNKIWGINIRRPSGNPKYIKVKGSKSALFGGNNLIGADIGLLCEGEFDCMIAQQELGDILGAATLGSSTTMLNLVNWGPYLMRLKIILITYDDDLAGDYGRDNLLSMGTKMKHLPSPSGHGDINDFFTSGGDLWAWVKPFLEPYYPNRENGNLETTIHF